MLANMRETKYILEDGETEIAVKHYLHYRFTALTKAHTLPEFSAVVEVDDKQIKHYSNEERVWIQTEDDWTEAPEEPPESRD
ncbi:hypothetical protein cypCar_00042820 [Cyprinus carpio]|nr:hypothetical protein cypCar_00042820 [Cyprinus carpio]